MVNNMIRSFIDTNVIVYANDTRDSVKQRLAIEVIHQGIISRTAVISIQVLQEYASVALTKLGQREDVVLRQLDLLGNLEVVEPKHSSVCRAVELKKLYGISFWDSLIIASAEESRCGQIISEDLNPGQFYAGATVVNPFKS